MEARGEVTRSGAPCGQPRGRGLAGGACPGCRMDGVRGRGPACPGGALSGVGGAFLQPFWGDPSGAEVGFKCPEPAWQGHRDWDGV